MSRGLSMFIAGTLTVATTYHLFSLNLQKDNELAKSAFSRMKITMLDSVHQKEVISVNIGTQTSLCKAWAKALDQRRSLEQWCEVHCEQSWKLLK